MRATRRDKGIPRTKCPPGCKCGKHRRPEMDGNRRGLGHYSGKGHAGQTNPNWKGDAAHPESVKARGRRAARQVYPTLRNVKCACEQPAAERHHKDGDVHNNSPDNIVPMCVPCHKAQHEIREGR